MIDIEQDEQDLRDILATALSRFEAPDSLPTAALAGGRQRRRRRLQIRSAVAVLIVAGTAVGIAVGAAHTATDRHVDTVATTPIPSNTPTSPAAEEDSERSVDGVTVGYLPPGYHLAVPPKAYELPGGIRLTQATYLPPDSSWTTGRPLPLGTLVIAVRRPGGLAQVRSDAGALLPCHAQLGRFGGGGLVRGLPSGSTDPPIRTFVGISYTADSDAAQYAGDAVRDRVSDSLSDTGHGSDEPATQTSAAPDVCAGP